MRLDLNDANTLLCMGVRLCSSAVRRRSADIGTGSGTHPANTTILNIKGQALFQSGHEKEGIALI